MNDELEALKRLEAAIRKEVAQLEATGFSTLHAVLLGTLKRLLKEMDPCK